MSDGHCRSIDLRTLLKMNLLNERYSTFFQYSQNGLTALLEYNYTISDQKLNFRGPNNGRYKIVAVNYVQFHLTNLRMLIVKHRVDKKILQTQLNGVL